MTRWILLECHLFVAKRLREVMAEWNDEMAVTKRMKTMMMMMTMKTMMRRKMEIVVN